MITPELGSLVTEQHDPEFAELDLLDVRARCVLQNRTDQEVALAVEQNLDEIAVAVVRIVHAFRSGGRLIYIGAGTSGRLGVLDASECPPTFGTDPELVQGVIAGGAAALTRAVEGAEDDPEAGAAALMAKDIGCADCVVGITASGRTPFVLGALEYANSRGAATIAVTNNKPTEIETIAALTIAVVVGPEIVAGSTRLKAGTAQKLVLNMLTTQAMVEFGKTYGNVMVDVVASNAKLKERARRIVQNVTGAHNAEVVAALALANGSAKLAILMIKKGTDAASSRSLLEQCHGNLRVAIES